MDCPPKNDIDAIFSRLRAQPFNKVNRKPKSSECQKFSRNFHIIHNLGLFRLQREESNMGLGHVRRFHLHRLLSCSSIFRCSSYFCEIHQLRYQLELGSASLNAGNYHFRSTSADTLNYLCSNFRSGAMQTQAPSFANTTVLPAIHSRNTILGQRNCIGTNC